MKVRMKTNYGVTVDCTPWLEAGKTVEVDEETAELLLATGRAEKVTEKSTSAKAEKAVAPKGETRAAKKAAPKSK